MHRLTRTLVATAFLTAGGSAVLAQSSGLINPLRPSTSRSATPAPAQTAPAPAPKAQATAPAATDEAGKPKRARSEAQLANDNRMRLCGQEWRTNKAALTAQGKTWRTFNVECRARLKAQGT